MRKWKNLILLLIFFLIPLFLIPTVNSEAERELIIIENNTYFKYEGNLWGFIVVDLELNYYHLNSTHYNITYYMRANYSEYNEAYGYIIQDKTSGLMYNYEIFRNSSTPIFQNRTISFFIIPINLEIGDRIEASRLFALPENLSFYVFRQNHYYSEALGEYLKETITLYNATIDGFIMGTAQKSTGIMIYIHHYGLFFSQVVITEFWLVETNFEFPIEIEYSMFYIILAFIILGLSLMAIVFRYLMAR